MTTGAKYSNQFKDTEFLGAGETALKIRALTVSPKDLNSVPSTHIRCLMTTDLFSSGIQACLGTCTQVAYIYRHTHIHT